MKTLHEYLKEYIDHEMEKQPDKHYNTVYKNLLNWLEEGIAAYQSTENCTIVITGGDCPDCGKPLVNGTGQTLTSDGDNMLAGRYSCPDPDCGYEIYY
jgi:hypothetical protein